MIGLNKVLIVVVIDIVLCGDGDPDPHRILRRASATVGRTVLECREEVDFQRQVISDFLNFWAPSYVVRSPEFGCVFFCVIFKLQLVTIEGELRMENAIGFGKASGADDDLVQGLTTAYSGCKKDIPFEKLCAAGRNISWCFRQKVLQRRWAPSLMELYDDDF